MKRTLGYMIAFMLLLSTPAFAREGLYLGAFMARTSWSGDVSADSGTGLGARLGLGLGRYLAVEGTTFKTSHTVASQSQDFKGTTVSLIVNFPLTGSGFEPFILGGMGKYSLGSMKGEGTQLGIGFHYNFFPELSLDLSYASRDITFDSGTGGVDRDATARTIDIGIAYHFF